MASLSDALNSISNGITGVLQDVKEFVGTPVGAATAGAVAASAVLGGAVLATGLVRKKTSTARRKSRSRSKRIKHTKRGWKQDRARRSKQKWEVAYQKRKRRLARGKSCRRSRSRRGLHYTKNGQPYIIMQSGKARFVKKKNRRR